uniref:Cryptide Pep-7 n=1 Tax=Tityus obscurus TaxID=1221240 RepID=CRY7_TITOB
KETNAKPPA